MFGRAAGRPRERVTVIEANLDDMSPQLFGYAIDRLLEAGALDVFATPVQMKKSRPGLVLTVLARNQDVERLSKLIFAETTTLGMRLRQEQRLTLERQHVTVATPWGEVRVKLGSLDGVVCNAAPEFEDCRRLAAAHNVPLKRVMQEACAVIFRGRIKPRHPRRRRAELRGSGSKDRNSRVR